jgi:hypothetical protein
MLKTAGSVAGAGSGTVTQVQGNGTVNGITLTGTVTTSGNITLGGTLSNVNLTSQITGTLPVANGGTGVTTSSGASSVVLRDANQNVTANAFFNNLATVAAAGTTTTLTVASAPVQLVTGSGGQTMKLPDATTLSNGTIFSFNNNQSSGAITVNNNSNTLIVSVPSGGYTTVVLLSNATAAGTWDRHDQTPSNVTWSTNTLDYSGSITSATWNGATVTVNRGGTGLATIPANAVVTGNATGSLTTIAPGNSGNVLTSNGTVWSSQAPATSSIVAKTAAYTATTSDSTILASAASAAFSITLPTSVGATGKFYTIKKTDSSANVVTIATTSSQTIDGAATKALSYQYDAYTVQSDGSNWSIVAIVNGRNGTAGSF